MSRFFLFVLVLLTSYSSAQELDIFETLNWDFDTGSYSLDLLNADVAITDDEFLLRGRDTFNFMEYVNGLGTQLDGIIYRISGTEEGSYVTFRHEKLGYLETDDWDQFIDSEAILEEVKEGTRIANQQRSEGFSNVYVDGWAEEPRFSSADDAAYWAIEGHDDDGSLFINAKAIKLSKDGYTEVVWIGDPSQFVSAKFTLDPILKRLTYREGFSYSDYVPGVDTVAAVGLGALTYKLVTGKAGMAIGGGVLAALIVFAKKFAFLLFIPIVAALGWIKRSIFPKK